MVILINYPYKLVVISIIINTKVKNNILNVTIITTSVFIIKENLLFRFI